MIFTVQTKLGKKPITIEWHITGAYVEPADGLLRHITTGTLWVDGGLFSTGVAVKHPGDRDGFEGERLAFKRAVNSRMFDWFRIGTTPTQVMDAWKRATGKEWQENHAS